MEKIELNAHFPIAIVEIHCFFLLPTFDMFQHYGCPRGHIMRITLLNTFHIHSLSQNSVCEQEVNTSTIWFNVYLPK